MPIKIVITYTVAVRPVKIVISMAVRMNVKMPKETAINMPVEMPDKMAIGMGAICLQRCLLEWPLGCLSV
jgi:hypothetical protein